MGHAFFTPRGSDNAIDLGEVTDLKIDKFTRGEGRVVTDVSPEWKIIDHTSLAPLDDLKRLLASRTGRAVIRIGLRSDLALDEQIMDWALQNGLAARRVDPDTIEIAGPASLSK